MLKKMSRREMLKMTAMAGAGFVLASCSTPPAATAEPATAAPAAAEPTKAPEATQPPAPTTAPAANTQEVTITYWTWAEANFPHFQKQADRWNQSMTDKPKIKFNGVLVPSTDETISKGMNAMAAGSGVPDVFLIEISQMSKFIKGSPTLAEQYLVALNDMLGTYNSKWESDYLGWAPYTWGGKTYGFEIGLCPVAYYYRADLFEQAGIKMPLESWEDWMAAGEVMKKAGHAMCAFDTTGPNELIMTLYQAGGSLFDTSGNLTLQDERAYKALELIISAAKSGVRWPTEAFWGAPHYAALNDGSVAGVISAIWYSSFVLKVQAKDQAGKWRVQPMPAWKTSAPWGGDKYNTRKTSTWGGTALTIPKQSANPQTTFDFLAFSLLTKEGATSAYQVLQQMPIVKSVIHDDSVTNIPDDFYGGQAANKVFADLADYIPPKYPSPFWNEAEQEIGKILAPLMKGDGTYQSQLDSAAEAIKNVIAAGA
jgi:ABC-type glycerol-3-phosphate transport system substrate-binding protein